MQPQAKFTNPIIKEILSRFETVWALSYASALAEWDLNTYMPEQGGKSRGRALGKIAVLSQQLLLDKNFLRLVAELEGEDLNEYEHGVARVLKHDLHVMQALPANFLEEFQLTVNQAHHVWANARKNNNFSEYRPVLEKIAGLVRRKADYLGFATEAYDALLDEYEEGLSTSEVEAYFAELQPELQKLIDKVKPPAEHKLAVLPYDEAALKQLSLSLLNDLFPKPGRLRLDVSAHPFTQGLSYSDVRITTRYAATDFARSMLATVHEFGHALYELQIDPEFEATPLGSGRSLSLHESQSRLWENMIARSREFAAYLFPKISGLSPEIANWASKNTPDELYAYFTQLQAKQPLRVEADELRYHMHIIIRFQLERALVNGEIKVADLPAAWNEKYQTLLNINPSNDAEGVLQDVHWSMGAIGYFPTYSIGTAVSAIIRNKISAEGIEFSTLAASESGFSRLADWLGKNIHAAGATRTLQETLKLFDTKLTPKPLLAYLSQKYAPEQK